ncbi:MAG: hypothetical protein HC904_04830 [Blastochloris sp.]|nr:hypothetical protein [Blastochloris sp.]
MKFFTKDWYASCYAWDALGPYRAHCDVIRDRLPPQLRMLMDEINLHDASVERMELDFGTGTLGLFLDGCRNITLGEEEYKDRMAHSRTVLVYRGLQGLLQPEDEGWIMTRNPAFMEIHSDEVHLLDDGLLEHRMIFGHGRHVVIRFKDFDLRYVSVDSPWQRPGSREEP